MLYSEIYYSYYFYEWFSLIFKVSLKINIVTPKSSISLSSTFRFNLVNIYAFDFIVDA